MSSDEPVSAPSVLFLDYAAVSREGVITWTPPSFPDRSLSVDDLADLLEHYRAFIRQTNTERGREVATLAQVSNANLRELLRAAYRASFLTDEGRTVLAKILVAAEPWHGEDKPEDGAPQSAHRAMAALSVLVGRVARMVEDNRLHSHRFREGIEAEPKVIAKLSQVVGAAGGITVTETGDRLLITGLAQSEARDNEHRIYSMPRGPGDNSALVIEIRGPGHLRVEEARASFTLHADRLATDTHIYAAAPVTRWATGLSDALIGRLKHHPEYVDHPDLTGEFDRTTPARREFPHIDVYITIDRLLRAAGTGHGGAIAVVPETGLGEIEIKYRVEPIDLGEYLVELWLRHARIVATARTTSADGLAEEVTAKFAALHSWKKGISSVAKATAADGCVVLTPDLRYHGFGGVIRPKVAIDDAGSYHDLTRKTDLPARGLLNRFGTRHQSAFALCRQVPGAIVFVFSQDGEARLFAEDGGRVLFADHIQP